MGQKGSRSIVPYAAPELSSSKDYCTSTRVSGHDLPMIKKAGSLATLGISTGSSSTLGSLGKKEKRGTLRRTRSFTEQQEAEEALKKEVTKRVEKEAREMNEWVRHKPSNNLHHQQPATLQDLASLCIATALKTPMDIERLSISEELKEYVEFMLAPVFDKTMAEPGVSFSNSGRTIVYNGKSYSTTVLKTPQSRGVDSGRCAWILYVENSRIPGWIQVGVVDRFRWLKNCKTVWDGNPHPFRKGEIARRNNGNFHSGRFEYEATMVHDDVYVSGFGRGDTVGLKVDFDLKEIQWTKNGEDYGNPVSFDGGPIWPSVSLDSPGEGVSLLYYTCSVRSSQIVHHSHLSTN